jgi:hypothetical protein
MSAAVVRLPTAARRKVRYPQTKAEHAAVETHRKMHPELQFPEHRSRFARAPWMRKALEQAKLMDNCVQTPELALALATFMALEKADKAKVEAFLTIMTIKDGDNRSAASALAWVRYHNADAQTRADIVRALDAYRNGEAE